MSSLRGSLQYRGGHAPVSANLGMMRGINSAAECYQSSAPQRVLAIAYCTIRPFVQLPSLPKPTTNNQLLDNAVAGSHIERGWYSAEQQARSKPPRAGRHYRKQTHYQFGGVVVFFLTTSSWFLNQPCDGRLRFTRVFLPPRPRFHYG